MSPRLITKLILIVVGVVLAAVVHAMRMRSAKKRMALVEAGRVCMNCESLEVVEAPNGIRCEACGYVTSNAVLHARVSSAELAAVTDPRSSDDLL